MKAGQILKKQMILTLLFTGIAIMLANLSITRIKKASYSLYYNEARVLLTDVVHALENEKTPTKKYPYIIVDLAGIVTAISGENSLQIGEQVNLTEVLQVDSSVRTNRTKIIKVAFPIMKKGETKEFAIFYINTSILNTRGNVGDFIYLYIPIIMAFLLLVCLIIFRIIWLQKKVLNLLNNLAESAKEIIKGNYKKVKRTSVGIRENEIEELVYGFELMQEELIIKEERENTLRMLQKELISCISHDLKTPISTIKAYAEALRDGLADNAQKNNQYTSIIIDKTALLSKMMNDLLEHSNAELNQLTIIKKEQYFNEFFQNFLEEVESYVEVQNIIFKKDNQIPQVLLNLDSARIAQVFYNIIDNAIKYMAERENIIWIIGTYDRNTNEVIISIKDSGIGIQIDDIPYVFNKFYRAEKSRSSSIPGSGLGLSICKYIIWQHEGSIECKSKIQEGTEFIIRMKCC